jgi:hypothetical protein
MDSPYPIASSARVREGSVKKAASRKRSVRVIEVYKPSAGRQARCRLPKWVKSSKVQIEQMFSGLCLKADA